jgi:hypothetical protein
VHRGSILAIVTVRHRIVNDPGDTAAVDCPHEVTSMRAHSVVFLFLVLGSATAAGAQGIVAGVKGGMNLAKIQFNEEGDDVDFDRRIGFVGGVFVVWPANEQVGLQVEALYSQKGARLSAPGVGVRMKLDYVDVPLLLLVSPARRAAVHVFGGPSIGIRVRARATADFEGESGSGNIGKDIERLDVGLVAGAEVEAGRLIVDVRHTWGLSNINRNRREDDTTIKNRVFAAMVGVRF